ncbi:Bifunctional protein GlmU [Sulfuracidifex tepidarius]|uniref:Bifunctional protein GlmU n=1 Tax=Sulfuracidifex tepidarius TaxID=1294262 RepID=A0A510DVB7_9CREN|nr:NDP-sugar synthase [Sulfuracidifex tepidarius]BBG24176.1 Bifunctional protein GlmU [Sulfuracidifex tepidarius]
MKAVVLAGGKGEGLLPLTKEQQKELISIAGKPVIRYVLDGLMDAGVTDFVIVTSDKGKDLDKEIGDLNAGYEVVYQKEAGIEGAIRTGVSRVSDNYYVLAFGDIVTSKQLYSSLISLFYTNGKPSISLTPVSEGLNTYGLVELREGKLKVVKSGSTLALAGAYVLPTEPVESFENYLSSLDSSYFVWSGSWVDIGFPEDLLAAVQNVLDERKGSFISDEANISTSAVIGKNVVVEEGATVEEYAVIKGPAYIGKGAYVGNFSLVRAYSSIERNAVIGAYSEISHTLVEPYAEIGSKSYLTYSVVGSKAKVGAGAITESTFTGKMIRGRSNKFGSIVPPAETVAHGTILKPFYSS